MRLTKDRLLKGALAAVLLAGLFLAYQASRHTYFRFDIPITLYVQSWHAQWFDRALAFVNELTNFWPGLAIWTVTFALFLWRGLRTEAFTLLLAAVSFLGVESLGLLVDRPRPSRDLVDVTQALAGNGFPSGHVFGAFVFYGLLIEIARHRVKWLAVRLPIQAIATVIIPLAGLARVYRGAHWFSDVLGGLLLGAVALVALLWIYARLRAGHLTFLGLEFHVVEHRGRRSGPSSQKAELRDTIAVVSQTAIGAAGAMVKGQVQFNPKASISLTRPASYLRAERHRTGGST